MPDYIYRCKNGHETWMTLSMFTGTAVICGACDLDMWRKPLPVAVNWGGIRPSQGSLHPNISHLIHTADQRREEFLRDKPEHEQRQAEYEKE